MGKENKSFLPAEHSLDKSLENYVCELLRIPSFIGCPDISVGGKVTEKKARTPVIPP